MQLFSGRSKLRQKSGDGGSDKNIVAASTAKAAASRARQKNGKCRALCCGMSRLSVSSSVSCSSVDMPEPPLPPPPQPRGLSNLAHGMVQARLQSMIDAAGRQSARRGTMEMAESQRQPCGCGCACACGGGGGYYEKSAPSERKPCVVLVAVDRRTYTPREEFRRSIAKVITTKRMAEPAELRALLNCYVSVNAREHRAAILEAFHEVCFGHFSFRKG